MRTIGVFGKGGVGKTTIGVNLACALGQMGKKVALVDLHATTSHVAMFLGIMPQTTINDHILNNERLEDALHPQHNMFAVPSSLNITNPQKMDISDIKTSIKNSMTDFDIVILDAAPGLGTDALAAMKASDEVLIVSSPTKSAIADAIKIKHVALRSGANPIGIIINRATGDSYELTAEEISKFVELPILAKIGEDSDFLRSEATGTPIMFYRKGKSEDFFRIAYSLTGQEYKKLPF